MSTTNPPLDGVRLQDKEGRDFILFKMEWFLMTPEKNAEACFRKLYLKFKFPFALCAQRPDGSWFFHTPVSLEDSVNTISMNEVRWEKIPLIERPE